LAGALGGARYSSKIIKAGALLPDTRMLLESWDETADVRTNLDRARQENLFGKASRSRIEDILLVFRQRYLDDPDALAALVMLARAMMPSDALDRILYFQAAKSDRLLHDLVTELLYDRTVRSDREIRPWEVQDWIGKQVEAGKTERPWSEAVQLRVAQGLLSALRDFGVLEGGTKKRLAYPDLPVESFAFVAFQLYLGGRSGERLVNDPEWHLFLLPDGATERLLLEAHQEGLLEYYAAGPVIRLDFPARSLEEYARVIADR
jgi:hypothetical protein